MPDEPVQTIQAWFEAWNARDFDALRRMYSPAAAHLRPDGFSQGADAIVSYLKDVAAELPKETAVVDAVLVGSDAVAVEWTASNGGDGNGARARMAEFFRFQDGKILSQHQFADPVRTIRLLTARRSPLAAAAPMDSPAATMVAVPAPVFAPPPSPTPAETPSAPEGPPVEPDMEWPSMADHATPQLTIETGPDEGRVIPVGDSTVTLGRAPDNSVMLNDPCTSGHHARVERQGEQIVIVDLGSTNGTYVNGMQVQRSELNDGDRITLGANAVAFAAASRAPVGLQPISA